MKNAEQVTFGGSGFDRASELRADPAKLEALAAKKDARVLAVWRGKPLVAGDEAPALCFHPLTGPVFRHLHTQPVFLGWDDNGAVFAADISDWSGPEDVSSEVGAFIDNSEQSYPGLPTDQHFAELRRIMARLSPRDAELAATSNGILGWHQTHGFCAHCGHKTDVSQGGWVRRCPACNHQHFPRTDPVVIMLITRGNRLLIGRSPGWPEGMYSLLAGFMEPGETIEAAVRREVMEETQVKVGDVGYLASQPWPFPSSLMIGCWGHALSDKITIDEKEIEDARWVTREEITQAWATKTPTLVAARKGAIAHFLIRNWLSDTLS